MPLVPKHKTMGRNFLRIVGRESVDVVQRTTSRAKKVIESLVLSICVTVSTTWKLWFLYHGNDTIATKPHWKCGWEYHKGGKIQCPHVKSFESQKCSCQCPNFGNNECIDRQTLHDGLLQWNLLTSAIRRSQNSWRGLDNYKMKRGRFGELQFYSLTQPQHTNTHPNDANDDNQRTNEQVGVHDGATHQGDEPIKC